MKTHSVQYKVKGTNKEIRAACDSSFYAYRKLLIDIAKTQGRRPTIYTWLLTRFYVRKITYQTITYKFLFF